MVIPNPRCVFVGNVSRSKEKGGIVIYYLFLFLRLINFSQGNFKVLVTPSELRKKALGHDTYWPFQMHGFPVSFDYPANTSILGQSGARKNPIENTISYAIIKACIIGELNEDGSRSFLRFVRKDWGEFISLSPSSLLLTLLGRHCCVKW